MHLLSLAVGIPAVNAPIDTLMAPLKEIRPVADPHCMSNFAQEYCDIQAWCEGIANLQTVTLLRVEIAV